MRQSDLSVESMFGGIKKTDLSADQIIAALKSKHNTRTGEWSTFEEFSVILPDRGERRIDLFVIGNWNSSIRTISYEIKVSRSDFLNEIDNPEKRQTAEDISCECWFVVPTGIVSPDEIPKEWGLMYCSPGLRLTKKKAAQQKRIRNLPVEVFSSVCKRSCIQTTSPPRKIFTYLGKDITEKDLMTLAKDCFDDRRMGSFEVQQAARKLIDDPEYKRDRSISATVRSHCGYDIKDGDDFLEWAKTHEGELSKETISQIQSLIRSAQALIGDNNE